MRIARKAVFTAVVLLLLASCSSKRAAVLSGDSAYEMQQSIMMLARDLPADRRDEFERAVETIMLSATDRGLSVSGDRLSPQAMGQLRGRTVGQVIESAKLLRSASGTRR